MEVRERQRKKLPRPSSKLAYKETRLQLLCKFQKNQELSRIRDQDMLLMRFDGVFLGDIFSQTGFSARQGFEKTLYFLSAQTMVPKNSKIFHLVWFRAKEIACCIRYKNIGTKTIKRSSQHKFSQNIQGLTTIRGTYHLCP